MSLVGGDMEHVVLLLAGGRGDRMGGGCPKQFVRVCGRPVIAYTMLAFERHPLIDALYVVCNAEWAHLVEETVRVERVTKLRGVVEAGANSMLSLRNGVLGVRRDVMDDAVVMVHEAVRPLVSAEVITDNLRVFYAFGNAVTALRSNEAYMVSADGCCSVRHIPREALYRAQTPQTFRLSDLEEILERAGDLVAHPHQSLFTMVATLFPGRCLYIARGSELNFKLTLPQDMDVLEALLARG